MKTPASHSTSDLLWRSPEQGAPARDEFAPGASEWPENDGPDGMGRRRFIEIMGSTLALGGLAACSRPPAEHMLPYVRQPEELVPGRPTFYATSLLLHGYARGVLVETHEGRPTKIEGNPDHPASLGASDLHMQAAILDLYDPDRSKLVQHGGADSSWAAFQAWALEQTPQWQKDGGAGLRFVLGNTTSPTLLDQIAQLRERFPQAKWTVHEPGLALTAPRFLYDFAQADVIVSLGADFLGHGPDVLANARAFAARRDPAAGKMNRLYVLESAPTLTGAQADHRWALPPGELVHFAGQLENALTGTLPMGAPAWLGGLVRDLQAHVGRSLVIAGPEQPAAVHAIVARINQKLGNFGKTLVGFSTAMLPVQSLAELAREMDAGAVQALLILDANPAFDAPADVPFASAFAKVPAIIHHSLYRDETAARATWHLPAAHPLESWGDARASDGTPSLLQPMIEPLYGGVSPHQLFATLLGRSSGSDYDIVREYWQKARGADGFEAFWNQAVRRGVITGAPAFPITISPKVEKTGEASATGLELLIRPDPHVLDGRYANNAWLQELPKPMTRLVWENAAHLAPETARKHGLIHGQIAELQYRGRTLRAPIWVMPGMAENCVLIHLGYGRTAAGRVGNGLGFNAYTLQTSDAPWGGPGLEIRATPEFHQFSTLQLHGEMEGRALVRHTSLENAKAHPDFAQSPDDPPSADSLYPKVRYEGHAWGMTIDLSTCLGCNVCTLACQAENSIPTVGREQAMRGRAMHWIRVDRYYSGPVEAPTILHQPVPCMQCENAPCEVVCPVGATVHDHEGLNVMVYNRCVGTRYCSNNCPYKVRRFNFLSYTDSTTPSLKLQRNPNVTVRARGVMEKCTYCTQRINAARIDAENAKRELHDGEITPACAQACPTSAITFGDINDAQSRVSKRKAEPRNYALLGELNARPRTTYLAKIWNPNPELPT